VLPLTLPTTISNSVAKTLQCHDFFFLASRIPRELFDTTDAHRYSFEIGLTLDTSIKHHKPLLSPVIQSQFDCSCDKMNPIRVGQVFESIDGVKEALRN
jgi:hypothetical protein